MQKNPKQIAANASVSDYLFVFFSILFLKIDDWLPSISGRPHFPNGQAEIHLHNIIFHVLPFPSFHSFSSLG